MKKFLSLFFSIPLFFLSASIASGVNYTFTTIDVPGAIATQASGINATGQIVGLFNDATGHQHGFLKDGASFTTIDVPGAGLTTANGINATGQIVGTFSIPGQHGFSKDGATFTTIDVPGAGVTTANGINATGQMVGSFSTTTAIHGYLKDGATFTTIAVPGAIETQALGINATGQIVGLFSDATGTHGFLKDGDSFTTIDVPGASTTAAHGINAAGQIVGVCFCATGAHGFLKDGATFTTIAVPGASFTFASGINDAGQIVGTFGTFSAGVHGFLATPNQPPVANNDSYSTNEDTTLMVSPGVLANDSDPDNIPTELVALQLTGPAHGALTLNSNGSFTYAPNANFFGTDSFTYKARDPSNAESNVATVTITVNPVNDPPSFTKGVDQTVLEDAGPQTVAGWATNISAGPANESSQTLTFLVTNSNNSLFTAQPVISANGTLTYTPAPNANGMATVTVRLRDSGGTANGGVDTSAPQSFTINVTPVNDAPILSAIGNKTVNEGESSQFAVSATDVDGDPLSFLASGLPPGATFNPSTKTFSYTPGFGVSTSAANSFFDVFFTVSDGQGGSDSETVRITVIDAVAPFAAFNAKVEIEFGSQAEFELKANFTLHPETDGIHPLTEAVGFQVGTFSTTIPAGSFKQDKKGRFKFEGVIGGVKLEAVIRPLGGRNFEFKAEGKAANLSGTVNPVTVSLTILNDGGSTIVNAEFE